MTVLSPFVYWAQNEDNLFIKVDLKDTQEPKIDIGRKKLHFLCKGVGAQGFQEYEFQLNFHCDVQENGNNFIKISDYKIDLTLRKAEKGWWPRLTSQPQKPAWLKIDFDRWQSEEDFIEEDVGDVRDDYPNLYEKLMKEEYGYRKGNLNPIQQNLLTCACAVNIKYLEDFKKVYLTLYNLFMYVGFMYITSVLCIRYAKEGTDFFPTVYESVGHVMKYLQILQILEIFHPMVGYVRGGAFVPFLQIVGRFFILFLMLDKEERIQKMPVTFYLFLAWSAIEIIRYPYYMSQLYKKENSLLTWLRYSAWIILYPIGFTCEAVVVFRNLIFVEASGKWTLSLPNALNFTFHFPTFLRIYLLFIMIPAMYTLMSHMYKTRQQKLGRNKRKFKA